MKIIYIIITFCSIASFHLPVLAHSNTDSLKRIFRDSVHLSIKSRAKLLHQIAYYSTNADTIIHYSNIAINLTKEHDNLIYYYALSLSANGLGHMEKGALEIALNRFIESVKIHESNEHAIALATNFNYISSVYNSQHNLSNAVYYQKKAIEIMRKHDDPFRLASFLNNLGYTYYEHQLYDSALTCYREALEIYNSIDYEFGAAYCIGNIGLVYCYTNRYKESTKNLLGAIETLEEYDDYYALSEFLTVYSRILQHEGSFNEALQNARLGFQYASSNNRLNFKQEAAYRLSKIFADIEKFDSAYYYQGLHYELSDSIRNIETVLRMANLRTSYEVEQKQTQVDVLNKKRIIRVVIIIGLTVIIVLTILLVLLYYNNWKKARRFSATLECRKKESDQQRAELSDLNNIKDRFFSIISHDLRGPISSIGGITLIIKKSIDTIDPKRLHEVVEYIDQTVISLTGLLDNLLNWALNQQGQFPLKIEHVDTKTTIEDVVKMLSTVSKHKEIKVELNLGKYLIIRADKNTLMTVFRNLLSNAYKFTPSGGSISISSRLNENNKVEITFKDKGVGIPEEKLKTIFLLHENKSTKGTANEKGTGLGLTLVQDFVQLNNGKINVDSTVGFGTTFTLCFPQIDSALIVEPGENLIQDSTIGSNRN
ncbi:MAG: tetratricopeptide repeat-containing sensor histidine kinase [Bacteroidales bacterium]|nr:tetratricopeptide repeat-containing sensor histidine kinase [Bacteroidales bacterium]